VSNAGTQLRYAQATTEAVVKAIGGFAR